MMLRPLACLALSAILATAVAPAAHAQQYSRETENRLQRLEREMQVLNRQVFNGTSGQQRSGNQVVTGTRSSDLPADYAANIEIRMGELERQIRDITGRLERQEGAIRMLNSEYQRKYEDMSLRVEDLEARLAAGPAPASPLAAPSSSQSMDGVSDTQASNALATSPALPEDLPAQPEIAAPNAPDGLSPQGLYDAAFNTLRSGDFGAAEQGFRSFLAKNPEHDLADNAQYWLGETYYVRKQYDAAAVAFARAVKQYPDGNKTPDSLLKLGMSLGELGQTSKACIAFGQLASKSDQINGTLRRRLGDEQARYGCQQ